MKFKKIHMHTQTGHEHVCMHLLVHMYTIVIEREIYSERAGRKPFKAKILFLVIYADCKIHILVFQKHLSRNYLTIEAN